MDDFSEFCFEVELEDIRMSSIYHSRTNGCPSNPILRHLDRAIVYQAWLLKYPGSQMQVVSLGLSDHCLLVIHLNLEGPPRKGFVKFFNCWIKHPDLLSIV